MSRSLRVATLAMLIGGWAYSTSAALARTGNQVVSYHGYRLSVPASWPVYDLTAHPGVCARFNRHAVYLGAPGAEQRCPAHEVGRTEAILVSPLVGRGARAGGGGGAALLGAGDQVAEPRQGSSVRIIVAARRLSVTATWSRHRSVIERALGRGALGALGGRETGTTAARRSTQRAAGDRRAGQQASAANAVPRAATYTGLGFDPCATPSAAAMSAWASSPYRAVGVYVGGANMACSQPNLTAAWVRSEEAAGWHLIPTYVGLQAPSSSCGCAPIVPGLATSEGAAAAADAIARAQAVGIGSGNPIYFDMEGYSRGAVNTSAVLAFLSGWTSTLHANGYVSGVYSSAVSGIADFVAAEGTSFIEPDDIWIADWNGLPTTSDPYVPATDFAAHQRLHQYSGGQNVTYGGVTMNIDGDYLDGATAASGGGGQLVPDGTFVQVAGSTDVYRIAGGAPLFVSSWNEFGGPQPVAVLTQQQFDSLNPVPADRTFLTTTTGAIYRIAGGAPIPVSSWSVFGGVRPAVTIDQWDIDNIINPVAHMNIKPADGTVVEGLPSQTYWGFSAGTRGRLSPTSGAITVDDAGLGTYVQVAVLSGSLWCAVPGLRHLTIRKAAGALRRAHCRLGTIHRPRHVARHHILRVKTQSAARGTRHRASFVVNLTVI
jgi:hypothetical protein